MEFREAVSRRRMVRSFDGRPVPDELVTSLLRGALRSPTAGNARGVAWILLRGGQETARYWELTTTPDWRASSRRWPGLSRAPVVALSLASPAAYLARYTEPDKWRAGLGFVGGASRTGGDTGRAPDHREAGSGEDAWPVPYWFGDAAFSTMALLLGAVDAGLGACFLGAFRGEAELLGALEVPASWRLFGSVLLGYPDGLDHRSASLDRPPVTERLHRGRWGSPR